MIGQAIAGVTPAMLTLVVDAVSEKNSKKAVMQRAFSYFLSSSLILAAAHFGLHTRSTQSKLILSTSLPQISVSLSRHRRNAQGLRRNRPCTCRCKALTSLQLSLDSILRLCNQLVRFPRPDCYRHINSSRQTRPDRGSWFRALEHRRSARPHFERNTDTLYQKW